MSSLDFSLFDTGGGPMLDTGGFDFGGAGGYDFGAMPELAPESSISPQYGGDLYGAWNPQPGAPGSAATAPPGGGLSGFLSSLTQPGTGGGLSGMLPSTAQGWLGLLSTGIGLGSGIAGLAGGASAEERRLRQLAMAQQQQSQALLAQTEPLRAAATQRILAALDPNTPVNVGPGRDALERQFQVARQRTIEGAGARGGALTGALTNLEGHRAVGVGSLEQAARDQALSQALQVGFGVAPGAASMSTGAALGAFSSLSQIAGQRESAAGSALGQSAALAALLSMKGDRG